MFNPTSTSYSLDFYLFEHFKNPQEKKEHVRNIKESTSSTTQGKKQTVSTIEEYLIWQAENVYAQ